MSESESSNRDRTPADDELEKMLDDLRPRLRAVYVHFGIPIEDAEDLLQQTLLTYLHKKDEVQNPARWIVGTVRNRCRHYWRQRRRQLYHSVDTAILETVAEPGRTRQEQADLRRDLNGVLAHISERCREALRLRYALGMKPAEVAKSTGYSPSGIYKILERCLSAFTRALVTLGLLEEGAVRSS